MMWVVFRISLLRLWNNRQELLVTFLVPVLFFSIFALIFSRGVGQPTMPVRVAFVDDDRTTESQQLIRQASQQPDIRPLPRVVRTSDSWPIDNLAKLLISQHRAEVVVYVPKGFTSQDPDAPTLSIQLFNEGMNPIGPRLVEATLAQSIALELSRANLQANNLIVDNPNKLAATNELSKQSTVVPASFVASTSPTQQAAASKNSARVDQVFESISAFESNKHQPKIALYAAGIAVMFLLFSAGSAGGSLLDEREAGTLGRLLSSRLTISELLAGKWLYITFLGFTQTTVMFAWGQLVFQVDLTGHLTGFLIMTLLTSAVCASFGLVLAAACTSRQQLNAVSMVIVLSMSAIGGSMVPRYIMSDTMKSLGKLTFNGWALDGYQKIFWYDLPAGSLSGEVCVLALITVLLGVVAHQLAQRWRLA